MTEESTYTFPFQRLMVLGRIGSYKRLHSLIASKQSISGQEFIDMLQATFVLKDLLWTDFAQKMGGSFSRTERWLREGRKPPTPSDREKGRQILLEMIEAKIEEYQNALKSLLGRKATA